MVSPVRFRPSALLVSENDRRTPPRILAELSHRQCDELPRSAKLYLVAKSKTSAGKKAHARRAMPVRRSATVKKAEDKAFVIHMNSQGRLTLPASARRRLGLDGEADFQLAVDSHAFVLKPAVVLTLEDAWAYTPEHRGLLARAHEDSRRGRVRRLTESQLDRVAAAR